MTYFRTATEVMGDALIDEIGKLLATFNAEQMDAFRKLFPEGLESLSLEQLGSVLKKVQTTVRSNEETAGG